MHVEPRRGVQLGQLLGPLELLHQHGVGRRAQQPRLDLLSESSEQEERRDKSKGTPDGVGEEGWGTLSLP